tara:strand:- start:11 stop:451 length:441 start_codon:yes stop_codon:yes gene_type:complete
MEDHFLNIQHLKNELISKTCYSPIIDLLPHEKILFNRLNGLKAYINSLSPSIIIPSIIVCSNTKTIIDGHHRYYALKDMNIKFAPTTYIYYESEKVITNATNSIRKKRVIDSSASGNLCAPKTTDHKIKFKTINYPLILLSDLMIV